MRELNEKTERNKLTKQSKGITINCNATTAAKLSEMYRGFTNIHAIY